MRRGSRDFLASSKDLGFRSLQSVPSLEIVDEKDWISYAVKVKRFEFDVLSFFLIYVTFSDLMSFDFCNFLFATQEILYLACHHGHSLNPSKAHQIFRFLEQSMHRNTNPEVGRSLLQMADPS